MKTEKQNFENLLAMLPQKEEPLLAIAESEPDRADWVLIQENTLELTKAHKAANKSLEAISELHQLCGIDSFEKLLNAQNNVKLFIQGRMLSIPALKTLAENIPINLLNVPPNLQRAETLLAGVIDKQFLFFTDGEWQINFDALEFYLEQFRKYAKTIEQLEKYFLTKNLCTYLNGLTIGTYSRHAFVNRMIQIAANPEGTYGFIPDTNWILADDQKDFLN